MVCTAETGLRTVPMLLCYASVVMLCSQLGMLGGSQTITCTSQCVARHTTWVRVTFVECCSQ